MVWSTGYGGIFRPPAVPPLSEDNADGGSFLTAPATRYIARALWLIWPFLLAAMVLHRQAHPFRVVSDDHSYYNIARQATAQAKDASAQGGILAGVKAFAGACSVEGPLPAHVPRKRPLLLWTWAAAYLLGGDQCLAWTWRALYVLTVASLLLLLRKISSPLIASLFAGLVAVAPATQGLLSWMACATYLVSYPLLLLGTYILLSYKGVLPSLGGVLLLTLALMSREVAFLLVPTAIALYLFFSGRRILATILPFLAVIAWFLLPGENRSALGTLTADSALFLRGAALVAAAQSASVIRNTGLLLLFISFFWLRPILSVFLLAGLVAVFFSPHLQLLLPLALLCCAASKTKWAVPGAVWAVIPVVSMCLYGHFTSRYAFEPLIGLSLALAPAIPSLGRKTRFVVIPILLWYTAVSIAPDVLYRHRTVRKAANLFDQRIRTLELVTSIRLKEWSTFAGRTKGDWMHHEDLRFAGGESQQVLGKVWQSGPFWRVGNIPKLHCPSIEHLIFTRKMIWEWNVWYWRVMPPRKGQRVLVDTPSEAWSVCAGSSRREPAYDLQIIQSSDQYPRVTEARALRGWLSDIPELNNPGRARKLLRRIWHSEGPCTADFDNSSFRRLELARLLLRDDGWMDPLEFSYVAPQ